MNSPYAKILASIVNGLIFPFLFYRFQLTPWSNPFIFFNVALVCFSVSFLVYKFRPPRADSSTIRTLLINFVISFLVMCGVIVFYFLMLVLMKAIIEHAAK
jgi:hypothetical protein